jgi:hypothetical protein
MASILDKFQKEIEAVRARGGDDAADAFAQRILDAKADIDWEDHDRLHLYDYGRKRDTIKAPLPELPFHAKKKEASEDKPTKKTKAAPYDPPSKKSRDDAKALLDKATEGGSISSHGELGVPGFGNKIKYSDDLDDQNLPTTKEIAEEEAGKAALQAKFAEALAGGKSVAKTAADAVIHKDEKSPQKLEGFDDIDQGLGEKFKKWVDGLPSLTAIASAAGAIDMGRKPLLRPDQPGWKPDADEEKSPTTFEEEPKADNSAAARTERAADQQRETSTTNASIKGPRKKPTTPSEQVEAAKQAAAQLPPEQADQFEATLNDIHKQFLADKELVQKREALEALGNALGRIGAGIYGLNTGVDMSAMKFDTKDWEKALDGVRDEFKTRLSHLQQRREEQLRRDLQAADQGFRSEEAGKQREFQATENALGRKAAKENAEIRASAQSEAARIRTAARNLADQSKLTAAQKKDYNKAFDLLTEAAKAKNEEASATAMIQARQLLSPIVGDEALDNIEWTQRGGFLYLSEKPRNPSAVATDLSKIPTNFGAAPAPADPLIEVEFNGVIKKVRLSEARKHGLVK